MLLQQENAFSSFLIFVVSRLVLHCRMFQLHVSGLQTAPSFFYLHVPFAILKHYKYSAANYTKQHWIFML